MQCPKCKSQQTQVIDSREVDSRTIRRRRECEECSFRFTTYEKIEQIKLTVIKRSGKIEPFDREKIIKGMQISAKDRIDYKTLNDIADEIESKLLESGEQSVTTKKIGNLVIARLKKIDEIAYLRFTSVYKNFQDISHFEQELVKLKN